MSGLATSEGLAQGVSSHRCHRQAGAFMPGHPDDPGRVLDSHENVEWSPEGPPRAKTADESGAGSAAWNPEQRLAAVRTMHRGSTDFDQRPAKIAAPWQLEHSVEHGEGTRTSERSDRDLRNFNQRSRCGSARLRMRKVLPRTRPITLHELVRAEKAEPYRSGRKIGHLHSVRAMRNSGTQVPILAPETRSGTAGSARKNPAGCRNHFDCQRWHNGIAAVIDGKHKVPDYRHVCVHSLAVLPGFPPVPAQTSFLDTRSIEESCSPHVLLPAPWRDDGSGCRRAASPSVYRLRSSWPQDGGHPIGRVPTRRTRSPPREPFGRPHLR